MLISQQALFEISPDVCYLDGAAYSPSPRPVRAAGEYGILTKSQPWAHPGARADAVVEHTRATAARLIGTAPDNVAILGSVSQGIATAARSLVLPAGHRMLRMEHEFPSQSLIWDRLAFECGLVPEIVPRPADGDWTTAVLTAITRPGAPPIAVAALTPLHWSDGALLSLDRIMPVLRESGAATVVDATQAVGVISIDVSMLQPDFLAFPTYKWLLGPYSLAFLYVAPHRQDGLPLDENSTNRPGGIPAVGARRYDKGERNDPILLPMALAGMELVLEWGVEAVAGYLRHLTDRLADHAVSLGLEILPAERRAPHILGVRIPGGMPPVSSTRLPPRMSIVAIGSAFYVLAHIPGAGRTTRTAFATLWAARWSEASLIVIAALLRETASSSSSPTEIDRCG